MPDEVFEIIDPDTGKVTGTAPRSLCHGNPSLVHRSVHVIVVHPDGRILLQKRSMSKDIQPGKWDTAAGGHLKPGETYLTAARREMAEELGLPDDLPLEYLFDLKVRNSIESENISVFRTVYPGPFRIQESELDEVRFHSPEELRTAASGPDAERFTPLLREELICYFKTCGEAYGGQRRA